MKPMCYTEEAVQATLDQIKASLLNNTDLYAGATSIKINMTTQKPESPIIVNWNALAYLKMRTLVDNCTKEIAWHGIVHANEERTIFAVSDILVYPQTVATATVNVDETSYEPWHQALNDEQYNNLKLQGHSHVTMRVTPSGVDTDTYNKLLNALSADSFYIFMITNKAKDLWMQIFDKKNNVIYEKNDIVNTIDGIDLNTWYKSNKELYLKEQKWGTTYPASTSTTARVTLTEHQARNIFGDPIGFNETPDPINDPFFACDNIADYNAIVEKNKKKKQVKGGKKK